MDEQPGEKQRCQGGSDANVIFPASPPATQEVKPGDETVAPDEVTESKYARISRYLTRLKKAGPDRHIELLLTVAIVFFAFCQLVITYSNNESSAKQVANLIIAANRINDAADSFSTSAADISRGVKDAAGDLGIQATSSQKAAKATKSVADTARSTLRISERAYITTALPVLVGTLVQFRYITLDTYLRETPPSLLTNRPRPSLRKPHRT